MKESGVSNIRDKKAKSKEDRIWLKKEVYTEKTKNVIKIEKA